MAGAVKRQPVAPNPPVDLNAMMNALMELHERMYHPGTWCLENEQGQCFDAFGGTPNRWDRWQAKGECP